jgi:hypothetical protein
MAQVRLSPNQKSARALHGIVLAKGIAFPIVREQQPPQVGVSFKPNAQEVKDLALVPVCRRPNGHNRLDYRIFTGQTNPKANRFAPGER